MSVLPPRRIGLFGVCLYVFRIKAHFLKPAVAVQIGLVEEVGLTGPAALPTRDDGARYDARTKLHHRVR